MFRVKDIESTPNPHAKKFILENKLIESGSRHYNDIEEAAADPMAKGLFDLGGVASVFYTENFVTIEKQRDYDWDTLLEPLNEYLSKLTIDQIPKSDSKGNDEQSKDELYEQIKTVLEQKVLPALANDGGGLEIIGLEGHTLKVHYQGACGTCPSATRGTLFAIESLLQRDVNPDIKVIPA